MNYRTGREKEELMSLIYKKKKTGGEYKTEEVL